MSFEPRIVIHGGAGNVTRQSVPPSSPAYVAYVSSLRAILTAAHTQLLSGASALDVAAAAVVAFEDNPLFNCGKGSVFNRAGRNELEASVMVTRGPGYGKRGVGVELLTTVKNPILLAKEVLLRGAREGVPHNCLSGKEAEMLAAKWGLEIVDEGYFYTEKRWKEHLRGLERGREGEMEEYLPQGTVGCVVMDRWGTLCAATSTGGFTNKLPGRIGDTPTLGAGFWAEEWEVEVRMGSLLAQGLRYLLPFCAPSPTHAESQRLLPGDEKEPRTKTRAVAMSGTGNGDYFLRLAAAHNVAARCRFGNTSLKEAMREVVGVGGEMQRAAEELGRWGEGDGEGGFIGIDEEGNVVMDLNCGGMFRGTVDSDRNTKVAVYRDEQLY
jgi:L-asparaginase